MFYVLLAWWVFLSLSLSLSLSLGRCIFFAFSFFIFSASSDCLSVCPPTSWSVFVDRTRIWRTLRFASASAVFPPRPKSTTLSVRLARLC